jgi:acyl dehydratase
MTIEGTMFQLAVIQRYVLNEMPSYRIVAQHHTGAVIVVSHDRYQFPQVVDVDGRIYSISRYLAIAERRGQGSIAEPSLR